MKEQFTPGPWVFTDDSLHNHRFTIDSESNTNEYYIAILDVLTNEGKANANLIAAAPDMYDALKIAKEYRLQTHHGDDKLLSILDAAISKANLQ